MRLSSPIFASPPRCLPRLYPTRGSSRSGFSVTELLVALVVAAILLGLLLAGVQQIGLRGRTSKCLANLRQISALMQGYLNDHRMIYPQASWQKVENGKTSGPVLFWGQLIADHAGLKDLRCFICPEVTDLHPSLKSNAGGYGFGSVSYGINRYGVAPAVSDVYSAASQLTIKEPSRVLLLLDFDSPNQPYDGWYVATRGGANNSWDHLQQRHEGSVNALFCDGHVRSFTHKDELVGATASGYPWAEYQSIPRKP